MSLPLGAIQLWLRGNNPIMAMTITAVIAPSFHLAFDLLNLVFEFTSEWINTHLCSLQLLFIYMNFPHRSPGSGLDGDTKTRSPDRLFSTLSVHLTALQIITLRFRANQNTYWIMLQGLQQIFERVSFFFQSRQITSTCLRSFALQTERVKGACRSSRISVIIITWAVFCRDSFFFVSLCELQTTNA